MYVVIGLDVDGYDVVGGNEWDTLREAERAAIYWDTQDPANEGWAWRVTYSDQTQESGPWSSTPREADYTDLENAVIELAYQHGVRIERGDVAADPRRDGGYAVWDRVGD